MPKKNGNDWRVVSISPLSGGLDVRSRPADLPAAWFRWKQNFAMTASGKLCRRAGFSKAFTSASYNNQDLHHQGGTREPITMLYENTWNDGSRQLLAGTQSRLYALDEGTGDWTTLTTGKGASTSVWRAATLQDYVLFVNGVNNVGFLPKGGAFTDANADLAALQVTAPRVVIQYSGYAFIMNLVQGGVRMTSRIRWSDLDGPTVWNSIPAVDVTADNPQNNTGFQDLDYGDEILAAGVLLGGLYVFTRRAIWQVSVSSDNTRTWNFQKVYYEPKNQAGCLVYPYTLTSDGQNFRYLSREALYAWNPYQVAPERKESDSNDWLYRAAGAIFSRPESQINSDYCNYPQAEFLPTTRELWISWPSGQGPNVRNNWSLVAQVDQRTADVLDHGFTAIANYRESPAPAPLCNETQSLLAASAADFCLKDLAAGVFYREMAVLDPGGVSVDLPLETTPHSYTPVGYYSELRGQLPLGLYDREKCVREILLDDDTAHEKPPCRVHLWLGTSYNLTDPNYNISGDTIIPDTCSPLWIDLGAKDLLCPDVLNTAQMAAKNLRASDAIRWRMFYQAKFFYFWLRIENADGSPAIGGDTCFQRIDTDALAMPKP